MSSRMVGTGGGGRRSRARERSLPSPQAMMARVTALAALLAAAVCSITTVAAAPVVCEFPGALTPALNASSQAQPLLLNATCSAASFRPPAADGGTAAAQLTVSQSGARIAHPQLYTDTREVVFDMSPRRSFGTGRVKVASVTSAITDGGNATGNIGIIIAALKAAKADGAAIATLTEEVFGEDDLEQYIDGPGPTAIRQAAKDIGIAVVCPMRLLAVDGRQYNAAIVIHANGSLAKAAYTGAEYTEKQFPVFGWPIGPGPRIQQPEMNVVPGQLGASVFDIPGVGRIAVVMCFDVNFFEAWFDAYAMGAQIVFWPTVMGAPDRDVISYSRLFRFHVVACGHSDSQGGSDAGIPTSGMILDSTGETVADIKPLSTIGGGHKSGVVTGTLDLDAEWVHENGPGTNCHVLQAICAKYPGVFEFVIAGCYGELASHGGLVGCTTRVQNNWWQRGTGPSNSLMLFASKQPENVTVAAAFAETYNTSMYGPAAVVTSREYIFGNRKGINSLRQYGLPILPWHGQPSAEPPPTTGACQFPGSSALSPAQNASSYHAPIISNVTCSPGVSSSAAVQLEVKVAADAPPQLYRDVREFTYDMSPRTSFVDPDKTGRVKVASLPGAGGGFDLPKLITQLKAAKADGAAIATLTEEYFDYEPGDEQHIDGPGPTAVRQAAKDIGIAVVCPMRLLAVDGRQYNAAIVIHANGSLAKAAYTGAEYTEKQFPVFGWPIGPGPRIQQPEMNVVPGQLGASVFDIPGVGRIAVVMCFDVNFFEAWFDAYAMGAQIVFWPTVMGAPDRDVISYSRLFRFHVVACGSRRLDKGHMDIKESGMILDSTGETAADIKVLPSAVVTGTLDLDAEWLHENGPGLITTPSLKRICAKYPGVFEFIIDGQAHLKPGCTHRTYNTSDPWQRGTAPDNSVMLFASKFPAIMTVKQAFQAEGLVPWRDYIFGGRKGINSLRQFGLPGLAWGGITDGPLPAPPLPPANLPAPLGNVYTAAVIATPESMHDIRLLALIEAFANKSQSLAVIDASTMTAETLHPFFKLVIVLAADPPATDTLLNFVGAGGSVIVVGAACRSYPKMQAALGISVIGPDVATTDVEVNVTVRTDVFADAWNVRVLRASNPSTPVTLTPVVVEPGRANASELANVTVGGATHPWLVARRYGTQHGMLVYLSVSDPSAVMTSMKFIFSSTGLGEYLSRVTETEPQADPIEVDDPWSQVVVDHLPPGPGPDRYRITILRTNPSDWKTKVVGHSVRTASLCVDLLTRWFGLRPPQVQIASVGAGIQVAASKTYKATRVCITEAASRTATLAPTIAAAFPVSAPVAHPNAFCCALQAGSGNACSGNAYSFMANVSLQQCTAECAKVGCPCFDYIIKIAHRGFSNCRVLPANISFAVHASPSGEVAFTTIPVPPPPTVVHAHKYCKTTPKGDVFALVNNSTQQECAANCTELNCPCFDWSSKVWAQGECRVVGHGASFTLGNSCSDSDCETAYTRMSVPSPPSPPLPPHSPLQLPVSFELVLEPLGKDLGCHSDTDCELNGICSKNTAGLRHCKCDTGWFGPTCGRLDLLPAHKAGVWPENRGQTMPFGAAPAPLVGRHQDQAMSWGASVVQDRVTKKYHGFFDTGCFDPSSMAHVQGYQLAHAVSDSLDKPFKLHSIPVLVGPGQIAAKTAFNPHANFYPDGKGGGDYVLFYSSIGGLGGMTKSAKFLPVCSGAEVPGLPTQPNASVTYVRPSGSCDINAKRDGMSALCALYAKSLDGPWSIKPVFAIPGPAAGGCNVVATPLRNGSVLFASGIAGASSTRVVASANEERLGLSIGTAWDGTYHAVPAFPGILWPEVNEPTEDQTLWEDKRGGLHILLHGNQWAGDWPSLHAFSPDGSAGTWQLSRRTDGYVPYSSNVSWAEGGWTNFFRRERPELNFNDQGEPSFLLNGVMFGRDFPTRQYSFTILQRVRGNATSLSDSGYVTQV